MIQFEKSNAAGSVLIDDVVVSANPQPDPSAWRAYHVQSKTEGWRSPLEPLEEASADGVGTADALGLLDAPWPASLRLWLDGSRAAG